MTERAHPSWDDSYTADTRAPWDIGRPQPAFVGLADQGLLAGRLLDAGCGTGENALLAAGRGADVTGVDIAPTAIARARANARERGLSARFEVADVRDLSRLSLTADAVIDSGVFHVFGDEDRAGYVASLAAVLEAGWGVLPHVLQRSAARDLGPAPRPGTGIARGVQRWLGRRVDHRQQLRYQPGRRHDAGPGLAGRGQAYLTTEYAAAHMPSRAAWCWRCRCGNPLDLTSPPVSLADIDQARSGVWRYAALLPAAPEEARISLGEQTTPLVTTDLGAQLKLDYLLPSGSYKDRGAAVAVSRLAALGVKDIVLDSSGNAGAAFSTYCAAAGITCRIFSPARNSPGKHAQIAAIGGRLEPVAGPRREATLGRDGSRGKQLLRQPQLVRRLHRRPGDRGF